MILFTSPRFQPWVFFIIENDKINKNYLKQTGIISPFAKQYFSTKSGEILEV